MWQLTNDARYIDALETSLFERGAGGCQLGRSTILLHQHAPAAELDAHRIALVARETRVD